MPLSYDLSLQTKVHESVKIYSIFPMLVSQLKACFSEMDFNLNDFGQPGPNPQPSYSEPIHQVKHVTQENQKGPILSSSDSGKH